MKTPILEKHEEKEKHHIWWVIDLDIGFILPYPLCVQEDKIEPLYAQKCVFELHIPMKCPIMFFFKSKMNKLLKYIYWIDWISTYLTGIHNVGSNT